MPGRPVMRKQMRNLDEAGEEVVFAMIAAGKGTVATIKHMEVGRRAFYAWLDQEEGRRQRYQEARQAYADQIAEEVIDIADGAIDAHDATVRKLRIDARKWVAGNLSPQWRDRKEPLVNITLGDQHLEALRSISVIEHDATEEDE